MSNHLKETFQAVNENINDLGQKCESTYLSDQKYKNNNDKNINILSQDNSSLKDKVNKLEFEQKYHRNL